MKQSKFREFTIGVFEQNGFHHLFVSLELEDGKHLRFRGSAKTNGKKIIIRGFSVMDKPAEFKVIKQTKDSRI